MQGKAISPEIIRAIEQMSADGKSASYICKTLGVGHSTVSRVRNGKLKSPETVSTPIEPVSEETSTDNNISNTSIPETIENVKPESDSSGQQRTESDSSGQAERPNNPRQLDYEEQRKYIADILKSTLEDIDEEIRGFEERIQTLTERLEERRQKQAYLRDFIRSM